MGILLAIPGIGGALVVVILFLLLLATPFTARDGGPGPNLSPQAALRMCVQLFNGRGIGDGRTTTARIAGYPNATCRVRVDGDGQYFMSGGMWITDLPEQPLPSEPNADLKDGRLTLR